MWTTLVRRVIFLLALFMSGAVSVACFHFAIASPARVGNPSPAWRALGTFAWGADTAIVFVLAAWLAGRSAIWRSWSGWARAAAYVGACMYGQMLFSATQDWLVQRRVHQLRGSEATATVAFRWPGADWQDFARHALDLLILLVLVWLLAPIFILTRSALTESKLEPNGRGTFSIASVLGWTTVAALILMWIKLLTWSVAPQTYLSSLTPTQALTEFLVEFAPSLLISAAATFVLAWGWSGRPWLPVVALLGALLIDSFGHKAYYAALKWTTGNALPGNVLTGPALEHWSFIAGRNCVAWIAFGTASLTGVRWRRSGWANAASGNSDSPA